MAKRLRKRIALAQNFFRCAERVRALVAASTIDRTDTVIEIGPGEGMITQELAKVARQVVAVEKDPTLVADLRQRFRAIPNVAIIQGDFLTTPLGITDYKLFANIPFCRTAPIMRTILDGDDPPQAAYLVLQKEAREIRWLAQGDPGIHLGETLVRSSDRVRVAAHRLCAGSGRGCRPLADQTT